MEDWKIIKNGEVKEEATCIYDACDKVAMVEFPSDNYKFEVDFPNKIVTIK